ncbi:hypothetical protein NQZ68_004808 [Dissostichus eleginoides]|nr:hypothetical protein NQZ68_004808 [Dissostichus eleginoides]
MQCSTETISFPLLLAGDDSGEFCQHFPQKCVLGKGPSHRILNSRSPSGSSPILSGPGHHYSVASLRTEQKGRLLCAHIKGGLSNLGLALCW